MEISKLNAFYKEINTMCRSLKIVCSAIGQCLCCCFIQSKLK